MAHQESTGAKRDFGSFHASNVQELTTQNEASETNTSLIVTCLNILQTDYKHPSFPTGLPCFSGKVQFGKAMKEKHFLIEVRHVEMIDTILCRTANIYLYMYSRT